MSERKKIDANYLNELIKDFHVKAKVEDSITEVKSILREMEYELYLELDEQLLTDINMILGDQDWCPKREAIIAVTKAIEAADADIIHRETISPHTKLVKHNVDTGVFSFDRFSNESVMTFNTQVTIELPSEVKLAQERYKARKKLIKNNKRELQSQLPEWQEEERITNESEYKENDLNTCLYRSHDFSVNKHISEILKSNTLHIKCLKSGVPFKVIGTESKYMGMGESMTYLTIDQPEGSPFPTTNPFLESTGELCLTYLNVKFFDDKGNQLLEFV